MTLGGSIRNSDGWHHLQSGWQPTPKPSSHKTCHRAGLDNNFDQIVQDSATWSSYVGQDKVAAIVGELRKALFED
jgi:hypothetical protein